MISNRKAVIFGISSYKLRNKEKKLFKKTKPWGVILFSSAKHADKYIDGFVYVDITTGNTYKKQDNKLINTDLLPTK